jgi:putative peptidoglycan lipid II flippase
VSTVRIEPTPSAALHARRIGIASATWGVAILLSRVIGLGREAVLGRTLGAGPEADLYATAFIVPDFLNYLLAGGALSIVFIPIFGAYLARGEEERASEAFSVVANFLCLLLAVLTAALWLALPALVTLVAPGFTPDQQAELVLLSRIVLPAQAFHVVGGLLSASMQARDRHALPALAPLIYTLGIIAGGLLGGTGAGAFGFAWGALAGSILGPFLLPLIGALRSGLRWRRRLSLLHPDLKTYLVRSLPIMLGFSIVVVDDWYLRREGTLAGPGAVATLAYAKSLMKVPMGVFGLAAGVAVFPTLQRLVAAGDVSGMRDVLVRSLRNVIVISLLAQAVLSTCGEDLVALVYGRSRLDAAQVHELAACLTLVSLGLSAWAAQTLLARGFYALGNTWTPALLGTAVAVAAYPLYGLARSAWSVRGLAVASSCAIIAYTVLLAWRLERRLAQGAPPRAGLAPFFARALLALCAALGAGELVARLFPSPASAPAPAAHAGVVALAAIGAFGLVGWSVGLTEIGSLSARVRRRRRHLPGAAE